MRSNQDDVDQIGLIEELEMSEPVGIKKIQVRDVIKVRSTVQIEAGNASSRCSGEPTVTAETRDVSRSRLRVVAPVPMQVGDTYITKFDADELPLPESYVLCVGCRLLSDRQFESQFEFFVQVDLSGLPDGNE